MNIYVGNLDFNVSEDDLNGIFGKYGKVTRTKIISDKRSGRSKGFGFVEMDDTNEANTAIKELNGSTFSDRQITVNEARIRS